MSINDQSFGNQRLRSRWAPERHVSSEQELLQGNQQPFGAIVLALGEGQHAAAVAVTSRPTRLVAMTNSQVTDSSQSSPTSWRPTEQVDPNIGRCPSPSVNLQLGTNRRHELQPGEVFDCNPRSILSVQNPPNPSPGDSASMWQAASLPQEPSRNPIPLHRARHDPPGNSQHPGTSVQKPVLLDHHQGSASDLPNRNLAGQEPGSEPLTCSNSSWPLCLELAPLTMHLPSHWQLGGRTGLAARPATGSLADRVAVCQSEAAMEVSQLLQESALTLMLQGQIQDELTSSMAPMHPSHHPQSLQLQHSDWDSLHPAVLQTGQQDVCGYQGDQAEVHTRLLDWIPEQIPACLPSQAPAADSVTDWIPEGLHRPTVTSLPEQPLGAQALVLAPQAPSASKPIPDTLDYCNALPPLATTDGTQPPGQTADFLQSSPGVRVDLNRPGASTADDFTQHNSAAEVTGFPSPEAAPPSLQWSPSCLLRLSLGGESDNFPLSSAQTQTQLVELTAQQGLNHKGATENWQLASDFFASVNDEDEECLATGWDVSITEERVEAVTAIAQMQSSDQHGASEENPEPSPGTAAVSSPPSLPPLALPDAAADDAQLAARLLRGSRSRRRFRRQQENTPLRVVCEDVEICSQGTGCQQGPPPSKRQKASPSLRMEYGPPHDNVLRAWLNGAAEAAVNRLTQRRPVAEVEHRLPSSVGSTPSPEAGFSDSLVATWFAGQPGTSAALGAVSVPELLLSSSCQQPYMGAGTTATAQPTFEEAISVSPQPLGAAHGINSVHEPALQISARSNFPTPAPALGGSPDRVPQPGLRGSDTGDQDKWRYTGAPAIASSTAGAVAGEPAAQQGHWLKAALQASRDVRERGCGIHPRSCNVLVGKPALAISGDKEVATNEQPTQAMDAKAGQSKQQIPHGARRGEQGLRELSSPTLVRGMNRQGTVCGKAVLAAAKGAPVGTGAASGCSERKAHYQMEQSAAAALAIRDVWSMLSTYDRLDLASTFAGAASLSQRRHGGPNTSLDLSTIRCKLSIYGASIEALQAFKADVDAMVTSCLCKHPPGDWSHNFGLLMQAYADKRFSSAQAKILRHKGQPSM